MGRPRLFEPEELRALLEAGVPVSEAARQLGVHKRTIYSAVHRYGLRFNGKRPLRVQPWCPPHLWPVYRSLPGYMRAAERRAIIEQDIAKERRA